MYRNCFTVFHEIGRALDSGLESDLVYLDFAKAFDSLSLPSKASIQTQMVRS